MPTGLTADIYEGRNTSLRAFALVCVRQLGAGYFATNQGEEQMPMDKAPVLEPSPYHRECLRKAQEDLDFWLHVEKDPETMKDIYDKEQAKHEVENIGHDARMKAVKERYEAMISRVEQWQVPEEYASLKDVMLRQLHESLEYDYRPQYRPYMAQPEPIDVWIGRNIATARRDIEYHKDNMAKENQRIAEINAYLKGLYDLLDEVEPYEKDCR